MASVSEKNWRDHGVKIVPSAQLDLNTPQTPGMTRAAAITNARAGAHKLWAGTVTIHPDAKTGPHHRRIGKRHLCRQWQRPNALGRVTGVFRRGERRRFYLCASVCAAPGNQRQHRQSFVLRAGSQRSRTHCCQPGYPCGREAGKSRME